MSAETPRSLDAIIAQQKDKDARNAAARDERQEKQRLADEKWNEDLEEFNGDFKQVLGIVSQMNVALSEIRGALTTSPIEPKSNPPGVSFLIGLTKSNIETGENVRFSLSKKNQLVTPTMTMNYQRTVMPHVHIGDADEEFYKKVLLTFVDKAFT